MTLISRCLKALAGISQGWGSLLVGLLIEPALCHWVEDAHRPEMSFKKSLEFIALDKKVPQIGWSKWRLIRPCRFPNQGMQLAS